MPLREDLLEPIAGENPSGSNLYYDKVFDQIKEARTEEEVIGSAGAWDRAAKKADHVLVIKLAGETLAKRTKDLRLVGWLIESQLKKEGMTILVPCLELIWKLQETFWDTFYPEIDEDGDLGLRVSAVEGPVVRIANFLKTLPITKSGYSSHQYTESRRVGYEEAADNSDKQAARQDAIDHGQLTAEDFDIGFDGTSKAMYVAMEQALVESLDVIDQMGVFHEEKYGDDYPAMNKLVSTITEVKQIVSTLLYEKRKTDPDVVIAEPEPIEEVEEEPVYVDAETTYAAGPVVAAAPAPKAKGSFSGTPTTTEQAYAAALAGAMFLHAENPQSPAAYLICCGIRFGETRAQGSYVASDFAVAPTTETRQALRRLANDNNWSELLPLGLKTMAEPCARAWLDLQRYMWRAAVSIGSDAIAMAVIATVRGILQDTPEMRGWIMDDDTPVANAETQQWIDTEVLPLLVEAVVETPAVEESYHAPPAQQAQNPDEEEKGPDIYEQATMLLNRGQTSDAIRLLVRDAELQPSGRTKFLRRVQVAQLCLTANQGAIAYPVLAELSKEIERRGLETWETGEMLAQPLSLLLKCLDQRQSTPQEKEIVFERLCRLDPQAALGI